jgi:MOSC domain-containing protein YiiM
MSLKMAKGLNQLGFHSGWVVSGDEIVLWENPEPQPSYEEIEKAAKLYVEPEKTIEDKLASVGLTLDDLKSALGL